MARTLAIFGLLLAQAPCIKGWIRQVCFSRTSPSISDGLSRSATFASAASILTTSAEKSLELLSLLLAPRTGGDRASRINSLIKDLAFPPTSAPPSSYDPAECLYGDLWCTVHTVNFADPDAPSPLWERISLRRDNRKGQQYYTVEDADDGCGDVINYSEIWGPSFHLSASGSFRPQADGGEEESTEKLAKQGQTTDRPSKGFGFDLESILSSWMTAASGESHGVMLGRVCPDDYAVTVTSGSIYFFGLRFDIPIKGTGFLRVLYADPKLRIFISPIDTNDTDLRGDWERKGLVVVQVRSDLVAGRKGSINLRK